MSKLINRVAVITGASKGIGAAIATGFAAQGAKVVVNYLSSKEEADKVVTSIRKNGGSAISVQADVSKKADVDRLFKETKNTFDSLDILVNNAGIYQYAPIEDFSPDFFHRQFNTNVLGALLTTQAALNFFSDKGGTIINISSETAKMPLAKGSVYAATKAALNAITVSLSKEFTGRNIRINSILPGLVETEGTHSSGAIGSTAETTVLAKTPLGRTGQPEDIAKAAVFLASDDASWITGQELSVSGGVFGL